MSSPPRPIIVSAPPLPSRVSAPGVPSRTSGPDVPTTRSANTDADANPPALSKTAADRARRLRTCMCETPLDQGSPFEVSCSSVSSELVLEGSPGGAEKHTRHPDPVIGKRCKPLKVNDSGIDPADDEPGGREVE